MIDMLVGAGSILTSGAGGAAFKMVAGAIQNHYDRKNKLEENRHERKMAEKGVDIKAMHQARTLGLADDLSLRAVLWTRRLLACSIVWTFCYIAILWAKNPDVVITTFIPKEPGTIEILWGLFSVPITKDLTVEVSTGAIAWGLLNFVSFVIALYFTPTGKR